MGKYLVLFSVVMVVLLSAFGFAMDDTLEKIDLSGFMRFRAWYTGSEVMVPGKFPSGDGFHSVDYQDFFLRNRFTLKVLPEIDVCAVFDIGGVIGKNDFSLGNARANLLTRDIYAVIRPTNESEFSIGLQPFSFQGGYVLARDASGFQYSHYFYNRNGKAYCGFIKAFDDADSAYSDEVRAPRYADDNIYFVGTMLSVASIFFGDMYYIYEHDSYTSQQSSSIALDFRTATLSWLGFHGKFIFQHWLLRVGGIFNWGEITLRESNPNYRTAIRAFLGEIEIGYRSNNYYISLVGEGATGDYRNPNDENSFQVIKSSHEFSYIVVDNYGGISIRGSGESSWYGLCGIGIKLQYSMWEVVNVEMRLLHFRKNDLTQMDRAGYFGDEMDIRIEYMYREIFVPFLAAGIFKAQRAYYSLFSIEEISKGCIVEILFGGQINY
ncbi:MAG: hypothetical protein N2316_00225 [Spirochaetes bacterium]|nr:hypothetical protein [Spirochaetota bacterium]